jgi:hypothetical protein
MRKPGVAALILPQVRLAKASSQVSSMNAARIIFCALPLAAAPYLYGAKPLVTDYLEVSLTPESREYCHVLHFPGQWKLTAGGKDGPKAGGDSTGASIDYYYSDYQFRVRGLLGTWFLVGAIRPKLKGILESSNHYRVNLADSNTSVFRASDDDWNASAVVPLTRKSIFNSSTTLTRESLVEFKTLRLSRSGDMWATPADLATRLSPDSAWVVLQSETDSGMSHSGMFYLAKIFLDVFSLESGKKLLTITGTYQGIGDDPQGCLAKTGWLTERYFIVPMGPYRERCLVCEFGARKPGGVR